MITTRESLDESDIMEKLTLSIYQRVKDNQRHWSYKTKIFTQQSFFLTVMGTAVEKLNHHSFGGASKEEMHAFRNILIANGCIGEAPDVLRHPPQDDDWRAFITSFENDWKLFWDFIHSK
jgi:hypothetical protein